MLYQYDIYLLSEVIEYDDIGQEIKSWGKRKVLAKIESIKHNEFYNAQLAGLKPEIKFIIHEIEYFGEKKIEYNGKMYNIIRTYVDDKKDSRIREIELICNEVAGDG